MMMPEMASKLKRSLILHEGMKKFPYTDTVGKITIGVGYNLSDRGVSEKWIGDQLYQDINFFYSKLNDFPWYQNLNGDRQVALVDMSFMGWQKFLEFKKMIQALEDKNFEAAYSEILNSEWALQVGSRAQTIANVIRSGVYDI